jgi:predicted RNA-binding Zn-ribbon protein involved in translation (DUF1610 family)
MIVYSLKKLYHFRCGKCGGWWSIADYDGDMDASLTCPVCGERQPLRKQTSDDVRKGE